MKYNYRVLDFATAEILEAAIWYNDKRAGLGDELITCFEASLETIIRKPLLFEKRYLDLRLTNINRFPYQIIFYERNFIVTVVAFSHGKRNPKYWKSRNKL